MTDYTRWRGREFWEPDMPKGFALHSLGKPCRLIRSRSFGDFCSAFTDDQREADNNDRNYSPVTMTAGKTQAISDGLVATMMSRLRNVLRRVNQVMVQECFWGGVQEMPVSIRNGLLMVLLAVMPASVDAGLFAPFHCGSCGPRRWIGFTVGIPLLQPSDFGLSCWQTGCGCGGGYYGGGCNTGCGCGTGYSAPLSYGYGAAPNSCGCGTGTSFAPPITTTPSFAPAPNYVPPTNIQPGPVLPGPTSYAPDPCAQPVCQTTLQPQQYTTYQNVPTTQYRREAYVEQVPVTTYQPQTRYRDVAYTVNRQVAQTHTRYVPQTHVSYVPQAPMAAAPCNTCDQGLAYGLTPQYASPTYPTHYGSLPTSPYLNGPTAAVPTPIALPQSAAVPQTPAATLQAPQRSSSAGSWQTVPQRQAQQDAGVQQMGAWMPQPAPRRLQPTRSMFQPAPSAASVWQSSWLR